MDFPGERFLLALEIGLMNIDAELGRDVHRGSAVDAIAAGLTLNDECRGKNKRARQACPSKFRILKRDQAAFL
jgi:hypothetical protein